MIDDNENDDSYNDDSNVDDDESGAWRERFERRRRRSKWVAIVVVVPMLFGIFRLVLQLLSRH